MPARSVFLVTLSLSEAGPGRFGRQQTSIDIYHTIAAPAHRSVEGVLFAYFSHNTGEVVWYGRGRLGMVWYGRGL